MIPKHNVSNQDVEITYLKTVNVRYITMIVKDEVNNMLQNKLGITDQIELAREEERISKLKAKLYMIVGK